MGDMFGRPRDWGEAIFLAFVVAMFFRTFVVELYQIPSGSMSPTLIGDLAGEYDIDADGDLDQMVLHPMGGAIRDILVFYNDNGQFRGFDRFIPGGPQFQNQRNPSWVATNEGSNVLTSIPDARMNQVIASARQRNDKILVNKFFYWFQDGPDRGDIMIFKVPAGEFDLKKPIFIKRAAAVGGEIPSVKDGHLAIGGVLVDVPEVYSRLFYTVFPRNGWADKHAADGVPEGHFLAFGDNSASSSDSRMWGPIPFENLKGFAIFRFTPFNHFGYIDNSL